MDDAGQRSGPQPEPITRDRITDAAVRLLDSGGEGALTYRALAERLKTGHGAIQWHMANKAGLLRAATAAVLAGTVGVADLGLRPRAAIHAVALGVFDEIEAHPWLGAQLTRPPWQDTMLEIFERIGREVRDLGAPPEVQFTATSALLIYIVGAGSQEASTSRSVAASVERGDALTSISRQWTSLDPDAYPFTRSMAVQLQAHDDRAAFLAGIDLILDGLGSTVRQDTDRPGSPGAHEQDPPIAQRTSRPPG